ncbi:ABC transporter permease, partial [Streptosporangium algeriense]
MVLAQTGAEIRATLRNGEQLLLTLVIPVLLLAGFSAAPLVNVGGGSRVDFVTPGVLALAVMSTAFTGQAIATGFERRYGVLKRLGATPLSRTGLMLAKTLAVVAVEALQITVLCLVALALGWRPTGSPFAALLLLLLG